MERQIAYVALFTALIAALGFMPSFMLPFGVPITAQSLGIMLAGAILGRWRGALAVVFFLVLVAIGLPLLSGGRGGLGVFAGPSVGFLIGWPIAAFVTGFIVEKWREGNLFIHSTFAAIIGGIVVLYAFGVVGLSVMLDKTLLEALGICLVYIPGDAIKAVVCGVVTEAIARARPDALLSRA